MTFCQQAKYCFVMYYCSILRVQNTLIKVLTNVSVKIYEAAQEHKYQYLSIQMAF